MTPTRSCTVLLALLTTASTALPLALGTASAAEVRPRLCDGQRITVWGTAGADAIRGTARRDVVWAGSGDDVVLGLGGADVLCGGAGRDRLDGGSGDDRLDGGDGDDRLGGGDGADALLGGAGDDVLVGGAGDDRIDGGAGRDHLDGGAGADRLDGGAGTARLTGGTGRDVVVRRPGDVLSDRRPDDVVRAGAVLGQPGPATTTPATSGRPGTPVLPTKPVKPGRPVKPSPPAPVVPAPVVPAPALPAPVPPAPAPPAPAPPAPVTPAPTLPVPVPPVPVPPVPVVPEPVVPEPVVPEPVPPVPDPVPVPPVPVPPVPVPPVPVPPVPVVPAPVVDPPQPAAPHVVELVLDAPTRVDDAVAAPRAVSAQVLLSDGSRRAVPAGEPTVVSSAPAVVAVRRTADGWAVRALAQGSSTLTARSGDAVTTVQVVVGVPQPVSLVASPGRLDLPAGRMAVFGVDVLLSDGTRTPQDALVWATTGTPDLLWDPVALPADGRTLFEVQSWSVGEGVLTGRAGDLEVAVPVAVSAAVRERLELSVPQDLQAGWRGTATVTQVLSDGEHVPVPAGSSAVWSVDDPSVLTVDGATGAVLAVRPGTAHLTVVVTDADGTTTTHTEQRTVSP